MIDSKKKRITPLQSLAVRVCSMKTIKISKRKELKSVKNGMFIEKNESQTLIIRKK